MANFFYFIANITHPSDSYSPSVRNASFFLSTPCIIIPFFTAWQQAWQNIYLSLDHNAAMAIL